MQGNWSFPTNGGEELSVPHPQLPAQMNTARQIEDVGENHLHYLIKKKILKQIEQRTDAGEMLKRKTCFLLQRVISDTPYGFCQTI